MDGMKLKLQNKNTCASANLLKFLPIYIGFCKMIKKSLLSAIYVSSIFVNWQTYASNSTALTQFIKTKEIFFKKSKRCKIGLTSIWRFVCNVIAIWIVLPCLKQLKMKRFPFKQMIARYARYKWARSILIFCETRLTDFAKKRMLWCNLIQRYCSICFCCTLLCKCSVKLL